MRGASLFLLLPHGRQWHRLVPAPASSYLRRPPPPCGGGHGAHLCAVSASAAAIAYASAAAASPSGRSRLSSSSSSSSSRGGSKGHPSLLDQSLERGSDVRGELDDATPGPAAASAPDGRPSSPLSPLPSGSPATRMPLPAPGPAGVPRYRAGTLQALPLVAASSSHLESALKRASRVMPTPGLKTAAAKARNLSAKQLDALTKELCGPLGAYIKGFPPVTRLHPFEHALVEITVGPGRYERTLGRVDSLRKVEPWGAERPTGSVS